LKSARGPTNDPRLPRAGDEFLLALLGLVGFVTLPIRITTIYGSGVTGGPPVTGHSPNALR